MYKKIKPAFFIQPVEPDDVDVAQEVDALMRYFWKKRHMSLKASLLVKDSKIYGTAFAKVVWNPVIDDVDVVILNPINVYPDSYGSDIDEIRYITIVFKRTPNYITQKFGKKFGANYNEPTTIYETWVNKGVFNDNGMYIVWSEKEILVTKDLTDITTTGRIPIVAIRNNPSANAFWGTSRVQELGDLQLLHNKTVGLVVDALIINNSGKIITTDDSMQITNDPSEIIHKQPGTEVTILPPVPINNSIFSIIGMTGYNAAQQLSDVYSMETLAHHRTASGLMALEGESNIQAEAFIEVVNSALSKMGEFILNFMMRGYTNKDLKRILGKDANISALRKVKSWDIEVDVSTDLPSDRMSKFNMLIQMAQSGMISADVALRVLNIPELNVAINQAEKQRQLLSKMQAVMGQQQQNGEAPQDIPEEIQDQNGGENGH